MSAYPTPPATVTTRRGDTVSITPAGPGRYDVTFNGTVVGLVKPNGNGNYDVFAEWIRDWNVTPDHLYLAMGDVVRSSRL